jgi:hypothetical protein
VELLNHLISSHRGKTHEQLFIQLREETGEDQEVLKGLLHDLGAVGEKLEALAFGIEGKRALWRALLVVAEEIPALRKVDLARLDQRAEDQRGHVEAWKFVGSRPCEKP